MKLKVFIVIVAVTLLASLAVILLKELSVEEPFESHNEKVEEEVYTEDELRLLQNQVVNLAEDTEELDWMGCGVSKGLNGYYVYLELREYEDVDYDALKEFIYEELGTEFPLEFELIPFPEKPSIQGFIRKIESAPKNVKGDLGTVLIVSNTDFLGKFMSPDASNVSITEKTIIEDKEGNTLSFEDLQWGMKVESYYRGMTLDTYPSMQGSEKLVVDTSYQAKAIQELVSEDVFKNKFSSKELLEPYYFHFGYSKSFENIGPLVHIYLRMEDGFVYYDLKTHEPVYYEGELYINVQTNADIGIKYTFDTTMVGPDFEPNIEDVDADGYYEIFLPYFEEGIWTKKAFKVLDDKIIRDPDNDKK
ncbi:hypothetical protein EZV73_18810 [Acidaminobacter sp. JC074]|uniref:hypothetical protein n=1 Tax=Acidaminobacter sp. JC074 TaxID=2530199 RepID=UPI001F0DB956|nr:hypothetical protein [Acidaminobacter sp. JC074]MCH4889641.1 hypothetical protein [Acidaminobacter sp. JC074]